MTTDLEAKLTVVNKMIFTKFSHWEYEEEIRTWTDLDEEFFDFCPMLKLVEVTIGAECKLTHGDVASELGSLADDIVVTKARAAGNRFQMLKTNSRTKGQTGQS